MTCKRYLGTSQWQQALWTLSLWWTCCVLEWREYQLQEIWGDERFKGGTTADDRLLQSSVNVHGAHVCAWVPRHVWMCVLWVCACVWGWLCVCVCACVRIFVVCWCIVSVCVSVCMQVCVRVHVYIQSLCACVCWIEFLDKKGAAQKACACVYVYMLSLRVGKWDALPTISHGWYN